MVASVRSGRRTLSPALAQTGEGLRRGDLVDQVQVDINQRRGARLFGNDVGVPNLFD